MSDISINPLTSTTANNEFNSEALQNLDKDAFLQLLVAQMKYQNPLSPVDSNEYLAQAAQYASVELLENMAQSQAELKSMQMVSIATDLVGQSVTALNSFTGGTVQGVVQGVRFGTEPILIVDGVEVPLSAVIDIGDVPAVDGETSDDGTGSTPPVGDDTIDAGRNEGPSEPTPPVGDDPISNGTDADDTEPVQPLGRDTPTGSAPTAA